MALTSEHHRPARRKREEPTEKGGPCCIVRNRNKRQLLRFARRVVIGCPHVSFARAGNFEFWTWSMEYHPRILSLTRPSRGACNFHTCCNHSRRLFRPRWREVMTSQIIFHLRNSANTQRDWAVLGFDTQARWKTKESISSCSTLMWQKFSIQT